MFTVTATGKTSTVNMRFGNAREALKTYRQMQSEGARSLIVTDNRIHQAIELGELEKQASAEEPDA